MKYISEINEITWYFLLLLLILAVCYDCRDYCIPNWLILAGYGIGFFYQSILSGIYGSIYWLEGIIFPIIVLFIFFYCKMIGAGDIKLFSVIGGMSGVDSIIDVMTVSLFFGGLLSVIFILRYRNLRSHLKYLLAYFSNVIIQKKILPYEQQENKIKIRKQNSPGIIYCQLKIWNKKEHIKKGHIHYSIAILCAAIFCRL